MDILELVSETQWLNVLAASQETPVFVFKHSTSCPISACALEEWERHIKESAHPDVEYVFVKVIESRPVSNLIADTLNVKHQSPQAILVKDRRAVWHTSHDRITEQSLKEAVSSAL